MVKQLMVSLDGVLCGHIEQSSSGNLSFHYDEQYRSNPNATPLSLSMPLVATKYTKKEILPFLQGLLPDSETALKAMARRYDVSAKSPFALLQHIGADVAGALQILPPGHLSTDSHLSRNTLRLVDSAEVGQMLRRVMDEYESGTDYSGNVGHFSLAGAQPKIALCKQGSSWAIPEDATPTTFILKPVTGDIRRIDVVEQLTMMAAARLGNRVANSELMSIDGIDVFVTERYDREHKGGEVRRIHQEDLCQALSISPEKKYQRRDGGPGVAAIAKLISSLRFESDREHVGRAFYNAFAFNIIAGCTDAHAKNYSVILTGQQVRLAPLYDVASYAAYWDGSSSIRSSMSVDGEYTLQKISAEMLVSVGKHFGLTEEAAEIVDRIRRGLRPAFESARDELVKKTPGAQPLADELVRNIGKLPLVL